MSNLRDKLIKLGSENPDLQKHIRPVLDKTAGTDLDRRKKDRIFEVVEKFKDEISQFLMNIDNREVERLLDDLYDKMVVTTRDLRKVSKVSSKSWYLIGKQSGQGFGAYEGRTMADAVVRMYEDVGYDARKIDDQTVSVDAPAEVRLDSQIETDGPNDEVVDVRKM